MAELAGRVLVGGRGSGRALVLDEPLSFWGGLDAETGRLIEERHPQAGATLAGAPWSDIALQAFVQGLLTAILSLLLYGRAVSILGASSGAAFAALCPAMTALLGIPILGEWPTLTDWTAIGLISAGVYIVSGGPLPRLLQ